MTTVREILDQFLESKGTTFAKVLIDDIEHCDVNGTVGDVIDSAFDKLGTSVDEVVSRYLKDHGLSGLCDEGSDYFYDESNFMDNDYYLDLVTAIKVPCTDQECEVPECEGPDNGGSHFWPAG